MLCDFNILKNIGIEGPLFFASTTSFFRPKFTSLVLIKNGDNSNNKAFIAILRKKEIDIYYNIKWIL